MAQSSTLRNDRSRNVRFRAVFLGAALAATVGLLACSAHDEASSPSTPTIVSATFDGTHVAVVRVSADDHGPVSPAPEVGAPALNWEFVDPAGKTLASGSVADPTYAVSEFAAGGTPSPRTVSSGVGLFEVRVPSTEGTLSVVRAVGVVDAGAPPRTSTSGSGSGGSSPGGGSLVKSLRPEGICVAGSSQCSSASAPVTASSAPATTTPGLKKLVDKGACAPINLLFVAEGYQASEMSTFESVVQEIADGLAGYKGYGQHLQNINVWVLEVPSNDSGITDPGCTSPALAGADPCPTTIAPVNRDTAFGASYGDNTAAQPRRAIQTGRAGTPSTRTASNAILENARHEARSDVIGFITNDPGNAATGYGGSADVANKTFTTASYDAPNDSVVAVAAHEMGHALFGLADEYDYADTDSACATEAMSGGAGGRGPYPLVNVTSTPTSPPWASLLTTHDSPTTDTNASTVGVYAGAYYCKTQFYRPQSTCLMRDLGKSQINDFCAVCLDHANTVMAAKEKLAQCACGGADAGADGATDGEAGASADGGASLVGHGGPLVTCPTMGQLVQQAMENGWWGWVVY